MPLGCVGCAQLYDNIGDPTGQDGTRVPPSAVGAVFPPSLNSHVRLLILSAPPALPHVFPTNMHKSNVLVSPAQFFGVKEFASNSTFFGRTVWSAESPGKFSFPVEGEIRSDPRSQLKAIDEEEEDLYWCHRGEICCHHHNVLFIYLFS